ncbi:MAG: hypothetical protein Q7K45_07285 [Nanoarchaeota archaeon]|nr:hypothetical protein [Nanoarchaeota archaeon]
MTTHLNSNRYKMMPCVDNYALAKTALHEICQQEADSPHPVYILDNGSQIFRPLTFKENLIACVEDYNTLKSGSKSGARRSLDHRLRLFKARLDSCSSIAYQKGTDLFTIVQQDPYLIMSNSFNPTDDHFLINSFPSDGPRLNKSKGKYNQPLTETEVADHPGWITAAEGDCTLLKEVSRIVFSWRKENNHDEKAMRFSINKNLPLEDVRSSLTFFNLWCSSVAGHGTYLNSDINFIIKTTLWDKKKKF